MKLAAWARGAPIILYLLTSLLLVDEWNGAGFGGGGLTRWLILAYCTGLAVAGLALVDGVFRPKSSRPAILLTSALALDVPMLWFDVFRASFEALVPGLYEVRVQTDPPPDLITIVAFASILAAIGMAVAARRRQLSPAKAPA